jgi:hypothetical protein
MNSRELIGGVEKAIFHPQTPHGGLSNFQKINKSPLGDLGVRTMRRTFSITAIRYYPVPGL